MKPTKEYVPFIIELILSLFVPVVILACAITQCVCLAALYAIGNDTLHSHYHLDLVTPLIILLAVEILLLVLEPFCEHFIFHREIGKYHGADYTQRYCLTQTYVLPHAYITSRRKGGYTLNMRFCYQYDELLQVYQDMKQSHRVYYNFPLYSIPGTTGQIQMAISRYTAKRLLEKLEAEGDSMPYVVLETSTTSDTNDPLKLQFISQQDIDALRQILDDTRQSELEAAIDIGLTIRITQQYLDFCESLLVNDTQLINLPSLNWGKTTVQRGVI